MTNERTKQKVVFRTGSLVELDMVVGELNAQDIPNFTREEWSSGLRVAMPATPTVGPGTWWTVVVPEQFMPQAKEIIANLPCDSTTDPSVWSFQPTEIVKEGWKFYIYITFAIIVMIAIIDLVKLFY